MQFTRRDALALGCGGAAAACGCVPVEPVGPSLKALAAAKGMRFGTALGSGGLNDPLYRQLIIEQCGMLVPENELKWYVLRSDARTFEFGRSDALIDFAAANAMEVRGHTLLWHLPQWFPAWVEAHDFGTRPAIEAERLLTEHVRTICERYRGRIFSWDVVNETIDPVTGLMRETVLSRHLGPEIIDIAFNAAREADPDSQLVYNDYMSWEAGHETHQEGVLRLLDGLVERGVPIDALGVQSHIGSGNSDDSTGFDTAREEHWRGFLDHATGLGLDLVISEFDVHDKNLPYDIASRDEAVAELAGRYLDLMFSYPQCRDVMAWGLSDSWSWLQNNWPREDGAAKRPTPYDAGLRPKPLRTAIANAFANATARR